jgi:murein DD-endopeptidase MepM/ murein hydrolase activator NlpD
MMMRHRVMWWNLWLSLALFVSISTLAAQAQSPTPEAEDALPVTEMATAAIERAEHNVLRRPIELTDKRAHWIDRTYGYGGTQLESRPVHLGVEFVNARDTPVYAAKAGRVIFAGGDGNVRLGPRSDYYGKVVILAHDLQSLAGRKLYTLYGHLDAIHVRSGQHVEDLTRLGTVGSSGIAIGPHLHFEVRVGNPFDYRQTRNPELWLQHYIDHGMIAGALRNEGGEPIYGKRITVRSDTFKRDVYTYGGDVVNPDPVWRENFTVGDLVAGEYEILVLDAAGLPAFQRFVQVAPYRTTYVDIELDERTGA